VGNVKSAFGHHFDEVPKREFLAAIPAHAENDQFTFNMPTFEQRIQVFELLRHRSNSRQRCHFI
jgi:hypothetical protein